MTGYLTDKTPVSAYQPSQDVVDLTAMVQKEYTIGQEILDKTWIELNDRSVIEDENRGQLMFNSFVDTSFEDPNEEWKWRGTRSMARNKGVAMHANLTANYLLPLFTAQNENDELDRDFSEIMRDIIEWMASPINSDYQSSFIQVVFGMITNPVTYMGAEFCEIMQTIRKKKEDGTYEKQEVIDAVLSGFQTPIYSSSQILINNAYERNIQKQKNIIKRRFVEKSELEAKYGDHPNWQYVTAGKKSVYSDDKGLFYDTYDDDHPTLVAEEIYENRRHDMEVPFVGGIYLGNEDIEDNPIQHRDNFNRPKYNVVPFGYHRIGEHFFYYKSMMNAIGWDNMLYDAMSEIVMNRALLEVEMPIAISGTDKIDSEVVFPNAVVSLEDKDAKVQSLLPNSNMIAGFNALRETEKSISEGSAINETISGQLPDASQKAFTVAQAQANAKKIIGAVAKSLTESVIKYGDLMKDIAINHITIPEVDMLTSGAMKLKYRTFLLPDKDISGKRVDKSVKFDATLIGLELSKKEKEDREMKLLEEINYPENKMSLTKVNPELFAKFNYLTRVDTEELFAKNQDFWQPILLSLKQTLAADPYIDQEALTRKLMYSYFQSGAEDLMNKTPQLAETPSNVKESDITKEATPQAGAGRIRDVV